jgi:hypothetical protein
MTDAPTNVPPSTTPDADGGTPNQTIINAIAAALENGLQHPGNPANQKPAAALHNPMFKPKGQPQHIADLIRESNRTIAESVVHLIENPCDCRIIPNTELAQVRDQLEQITKERDEAISDLAIAESRIETLESEAG